MVIFLRVCACLRVLLWCIVIALVLEDSCTYLCFFHSSWIVGFTLCLPIVQGLVYNAAALIHSIYFTRLKKESREKGRRAGALSYLVAPRDSWAPWKQLRQSVVDIPPSSPSFRCSRTRVTPTHWDFSEMSPKGKPRLLAKASYLC